MEENIQDKPEGSQEEQTPDFVPPVTNIQNISLSDSLAGVFSEPGETFTEIKKSTKGSYWIWPIIILAVITALSSFIVMNDEELSSEIKTTQSKAMKEKLDDAVKSGQMTREQADEQIEKAQSMMGGGLFAVIGVAGGVISILIFFFVKGLIYWGGFKIFKGTATFVNIMNVLGIASIITSIQMILDTVLAIFTGRLYINIGPVLFFTEEAVGKSMYKFIANFDLINIWYLVIIAIGFAKVSDLKSSVTFPMVFGLWLIWVILTSFVTTSFLGF